MRSSRENIRDGKETITHFSKEELADAGIPLDVLNDPGFVGSAGILEDIEMFDARFFEYSPREADFIDPQQRIFLECAWQALENAGYDAQTYEGLIGMYAGTGMNSYVLANIYSNPVLSEDADELHLLVGSDKDFLSTRVSYKLNLRGPSFSVQTACSTSLVAVHLACESLLVGSSDIAMAGGVTIRVPQKAGYLHQRNGIHSPDGHCRAFDAKAQGTVGGNGVGIVVLKRLSDALADGDTIHAVIKGSAINNDGSQKVGYTAPSVQGQAKVITEALSRAAVDPETITYIEAHGTATPLGDPIEIAALKQAFSETTAKGYCGIGSVKTNVGHLDAAAGVASLMKAVLALKHKQLPPNLHFTEPNPEIDLENSPFYINAKLASWEPREFPRRAGVSSFGIGGTNAHVVLEEAPVVPDAVETKERPWQLLLLSAETSSALDTATSNLAEYIKLHPEISLADIAYTLQVGRRSLNHRRVLVCRDHMDAVEALETHDTTRVITTFQDNISRSIVFMFPGEGAQYVNMGLELYQEEPLFKAHIDTCAELFKPYLHLDLRTVLYTGERLVESNIQLQQIIIAQAVLFSTEYALAQLWIEWGIRPHMTLGQGIGQYVAACVGEAISLEDAISLVALQGRIADQQAQRMYGRAEEELALFVANMPRQEPRVPYISTTTGTWTTAAEIRDPLYWTRSLSQKGLMREYWRITDTY